MFDFLQPQISHLSTTQHPNSTSTTFSQSPLASNHKKVLKNSVRLTSKAVTTTKHADAKWHVPIHTKTTYHITTVRWVVTHRLYDQRYRKLSWWQQANYNKLNQCCIPAILRQTSHNLLVKSDNTKNVRILQMLCTAQCKSAKWHISCLEEVVVIYDLNVTEIKIEQGISYQKAKE